MTADQAIEQITLALWGAGNQPHIEDLVASVQGLKLENRRHIEERADLEKELDGVSRTLRIVNGAVDELVELVGAKDPGDMRHKIGLMKMDAQAMAKVREIICPIPSPHSLVSYLESIRDRGNVLEEMENKSLSAKMVAIPAALHMKTADLVTSFAENLAYRLCKKQSSKSGWDLDNWRDECLRQMRTARNPIDVAAFAVFAWYHGWTGDYMGQTLEAVAQPTGTTTHITINMETAGIADAVRQALESVSVRQVEPGFVSTGFVIPEGFTDDQRAELAEVLDTAILRISKQAPGFRTE